MAGLDRLLGALSFVLLLIYVIGLALGPEKCGFLVYLVIGIPWATVVVYGLNFLRSKDYVAAFASFMILVELALLVYLKGYL